MFYLLAKPNPTKNIFTSIMTPTSSYIPPKHFKILPNASTHVSYSSAVYQTRPTQYHTHSLHDHAGHATYGHLWLIILLAVVAVVSIVTVVALLVLSVPRICNKSVGNVPEDAREEISRQELYQYHAVRFSHPDTAEHIQEQCLPEAEPRNRQVDLPELNGRGVPFSQPNIEEGPVSLTNGEEERCGPNNTEQRMEGKRSPEVAPDDVEGRFSQPDIESECSPPPNGGVNYLREPNDAREQLYQPNDGEKNVEECSPVHAHSFKMRRYVCCLHLRSRMNCVNQNTRIRRF